MRRGEAHLIARTLDLLGADAVDAEDLQATCERYAEDPMASDDPEDFLLYLRDQNVIDSQTYVRANREHRVRLKHPSFEHLPDRERHYELLGAVDEGGMGEIRVGRDPFLDRKVALKLLRIEKVASKLATQRFVREAQVTAKLAHPNIVPVYSLHAEADGRASFAMKLVHGQTLQQLVRDVRQKIDEGRSVDPAYSLRRRIELFLRVCDAMSYAHDMGVLHRDLKPANIMVGEYNELYVMDWGLAKIMDDPLYTDGEGVWDRQIEDADGADSVKTQHGALVGTPLYMAPEQAVGRHDKIDYRTDQYSLGAILFELVTLRRMIPGNRVNEILKNIVNVERNPVESVDPSERIDPELAAIIIKSTAPRIDDRYESVKALAEDLRRYLDNREVQAHPDGLVRTVQRWMIHNRRITTVIFFSLVMAAAGAVIWGQWKQNRAAQESRVREQQLSRLQTYVSERSHRIDRQFLRFELLVKQLAMAAAQLLEEGRAHDGPLYSNADFGDPATAPPDAKISPLYKKVVSVESPVYKLGPDVEFSEVEDDLKRLQPIGKHFRSILLDSRLDNQTPITDAGEAWEAIAVDGTPGRWSYVALDKGVHIAYPGKGGYPRDYDPRDRPWYRNGKDRHQPHWGDPYLDLLGQGLVLPCLTSIWDSEGKFVGVVGLEVTLDFVKDEFMQPVGPMVANYILDDRGRVLIRSSQTEPLAAKGADLPVFPVEEVTELVRRKASGYVTKDDTVYMLFEMPTLGWYYVAQAPVADLLEWE